MSTLAIASKLKKDAEQKLRDMGCEIIDFIPNPNVDKRIAHHSDLSFFAYGNDIFIAREMEYLAQKLVSYGFNVHIEPDYLGVSYPCDVRLNCVAFGDYFLCNESTVSASVLRFFKENGKTVINVNQGYTKCSVIPVSDNAIITDDISIAKACRKYGIDVLEVSKGNVILEGYDYGFIGGTAGVLNDIIVFNGDILTHPDGNRVVDFVNAQNKTHLSLAEGELEDTGSIIFLKDD